MKEKFWICSTYFSVGVCFESSTSAESYLIWKFSNCDGKCPANDFFSDSISSCKNSNSAFSPKMEKKKKNENPIRNSQYIFKNVTVPTKEK